MHDFSGSLEKGVNWEFYVDGVLASHGFDIAVVTRADQRNGIDRRISKDSGMWEIEIKTDFKAAETGNAFIEVVSVDTAGKDGWAYTSTADCIGYMVPHLGEIYMIKPSALRRILPQWESRYPTRAAQNNGYKTHGACVPLPELKKLAYTTIKTGVYTNLE